MISFTKVGFENRALNRFREVCVMNDRLETVHFNTSVQNRRTHERYRTSGGLVAVFHPHDCVIGRVVDISEEGMGVLVNKDALSNSPEKVGLYVKGRGYILRKAKIKEIARTEVIDSRAGKCKPAWRYGFRFDKSFHLESSSIPDSKILPVINPENSLKKEVLGTIGKKTLRQKTTIIVRRMIDIAVSSIALIVFLPVMLFIAAKIKADSPGPAIFRQKRVGKNGELFTFYKFRSMLIDAKERFPELYEYAYSPNEIESIQFKSQEDPRLTPFGRKLRKTSLDELPNFINVLKGDMTLVGPRPDIPEMIKYYDHEQMLKLSQKPGITGFAQINGRACLSFQETLQEDISYIKERSIATDLNVLVKTAIACVYGKGAF